MLYSLATRFTVTAENMFAAADGVIYQSSKNASDLGKWRIAPEGQFCRAWWERPQERCYVVYQEGEVVGVVPHGSMGKGIGQTRPGQSGGLLNNITDTSPTSLERALGAAELKYEGVSLT